MFESDPERIALSHEWFGYHLTPDTSFHKFLIAVGEGANGKTVWAEVLTRLLGPENVSQVPLELFGDRFQLTATLGKLANIATEIGEIDKMAEGILKAFTSGDRMHVDRKFLPVIEARPTARLTFTTNTLPKFRDRSRGLSRRLILLPFKIEIPIERQDRELSQKLAAERSGIFNLAIDGLRRLRLQMRFTDPAICRAALEEYMNERNPARQFLKENLVLSPPARVACGGVYEQYRWWCATDGLERLDEREFGKELNRVFPSVRRVRGSALPDGKRPWIYEGIVLRSETQPSHPIPLTPIRVGKSRRLSADDVGKVLNE